MVTRTITATNNTSIWGDLGFLQWCLRIKLFWGWRVCISPKYKLAVTSCLMNYKNSVSILLPLTDSRELGSDEEQVGPSKITSVSQSSHMLFDGNATRNQAATTARKLHAREVTSAAAPCRQSAWEVAAAAVADLLLWERGRWRRRRRLRGVRRCRRRLPGERGGSSGGCSLCAWR
jgi:hypothetical protein